MDSLEKRKKHALQRAIVAEAIAKLIFLLAVGLVVWLWLGADLRFMSRLLLTSAITFSLGLGRSMLRYYFPDPRQDPAGQGLGAAYPFLFWTAVSIGLALWAVGWVIIH
jgi:hypothetical protein